MYGIAEMTENQEQSILNLIDRYKDSLERNNLIFFKKTSLSQRESRIAMLNEAGIEGAKFSAPYKMPSEQVATVFNLPKHP